MNPTELWCSTTNNGGTPSRMQFDITSYSQNIDGNYSDVNWRLRLRGTGTRSSFHGGALWMDGEQVFFTNTSVSWNVWTDGYVLATGTKRIYHNSDGNKQFIVIMKQLFYSFYSTTTWGGDQYYSGDTSKTEVASTTITANNIPRFPALSLTSVYRELNLIWPSLTNTRAGTITSWEVRRVDNNVLVTSGTSAEVHFGLYDLSPNTNYDGVYKVRAYANGGWGDYLTINIGATTALPTVSAQNVSSESASVITFSNLNHIDYWTLEVKIDSNNSHIYGPIYNVSNNYSMTLSAEAKASLLAAYPSSIYPKVKLIITVNSNGYVYRVYQSGSTDATITYTIPDALYKPTFNLAMVGYADQNSVSLALTGSNQKIIKGISNVLFTLQPMTANGGAIPVSYQINSGSISNSGNHTGSAITILLNAIDAGNASITAIDSRGKTTTIPLTYSQFVDYSPPSIESNNIRRSGGVTENLLFNIVGLFNNWSGLATTNSIQSIQYRYKEKGTSIWSSYISLTGISYDGNKYSITDILGTGDLFDVSTEYDAEIKVTDRLSYDTIEVHVNSGEPFIWKDLLNKYLGIGKKPTKMLDIAGDINTDGDLHVVGNISADGNIAGVVTVVDNLSSTSSTDALSANMGNALNGPLKNLVYGSDIKMYNPVDMNNMSIDTSKTHIFNVSWVDWANYDNRFPGSLGIFIKGNSTSSASSVVYLIDYSGNVLRNVQIDGAQWGGWKCGKVIDNLSSDSSTDALSAKQGKVLNDKILGTTLWTGILKGKETLNLDVNAYQRLRIYAVSFATQIIFDLDLTKPNANPMNYDGVTGYVNGYEASGVGFYISGTTNYYELHGCTAEVNSTKTVFRNTEQGYERHNSSNRRNNNVDYYIYKIVGYK